MLKKLSIILTAAFVLNMFAAALVTQAQTSTNDGTTTTSTTTDDDRTTTDSNTGSDDSTESDDRSGSNSDDSVNTSGSDDSSSGSGSDDSTSDDQSDCLEIGKKIKEAEEKLRIAVATNASEGDITSIKRNIAELRVKLGECTSGDGEQLRLRLGSDDSEDEALSIEVIDQVKDCVDCARLRAKLHEVQGSANEKWAQLKRVHAEWKILSEKISEDPTDTELKDKIEALKERARNIHKDWIELHGKVQAAKAAVQKCAAEVKQYCPDMVPRVRDEIRDEDEREVVKDRARLTLFIQWGNISEYKPDQERSDWEVLAEIDEGKLKVRKTVLFEDNDEEVDTGSDNSISAKSVIKGHWDGIIVEVEPGENAEELVIKAGDFYKSYAVKDLYTLHEINTLDNGMEVAINNPVKADDVDTDEYEKLRERNQKVVDKLNEVDEKVREHRDNGKFNPNSRSKYNELRRGVENYLVPEDGEDDFAEFLAECKGKLDESAEEEDVEECREKFRELRKEHVEKKVKEGLIPFSDVDDDTWYFEHVKYVKEKKIASGFEDGTFGPGADASRAELLKMAMEAAGHELDEEGDDNPEDSRAHWAKKYIAKAMKKNFVKGYDDGFHPNQSVTRAEAVKIIFKSLGIEPVDCEKGAFEDTKGHWAECIVKHAKDLGIIGGNPDGTFAPDRPISRAEIAKIIRNAIEYARSQNAVDAGELTEDEPSEEDIKQIEEDLEIGADDTSVDDSSDDSTDDSTTDDTSSTDDTTTS